MTWLSALLLISYDYHCHCPLGQNKRRSRAPALNHPSLRGAWAPGEGGGTATLGIRHSTQPTPGGRRHALALNGGAPTLRSPPRAPRRLAGSDGREQAPGTCIYFVQGGPPAGGAQRAPRPALSRRDGGTQPARIVTLASNVTISFWAFRTSFGTKNDQIVTLQRLYPKTN